MTPYYVGEEYISEILRNGYVPPEAFLYPDKHGFIQCETVIPVFYHIHRAATDKTIYYERITSDNKKFYSSMYFRNTNMFPDKNYQKYY